MKRFLYRKALALALLWLYTLTGAWAASGVFSTAWQAQFLDAAEVFTLNEPQQHGDQWEADGQIADAYYVYRHSLKLVDAQGRDVALELPTGVSKHDDFFGDTEIYTGTALRLRFPTASVGPLTLHWQGCAAAGICYPPQTLQVNVSVNGPSTTASASNATVAEDQSAAARLAALDPLSGSLLFFGFGLLLAFTPCTLPMIPIVSSLIVGGQARPRRAFALSLSYVMAMAAAYAALGVAAGLAGANLQAALQSPWLQGAFATLFLVLASSLFGLFELRLPSGLVNRVECAGSSRAVGSIVGAAALGLLSALLIGPCMTAPLAGALLYIGQTGSALQGGLALFALGIGMGLPLLAIAIFGARILPRPGAWMDAVRVGFGYVMVGMAVMMLSRFLSGTVGLALWGAWVLSITIGLFAWAQASASKQRLAWTLRSGAAFVGVWSVFMLVGAASGGESAWQPLAHLRGASIVNAATGMAYVPAKSVEDVNARLSEAASRRQWTLIDFYADWCVSCHANERNLFRDPAVIARLARMQVLRPDVTRNDVADQALLKRWGVMGPPTLILVGPDGAERRELRLVGETDAREFLQRLNAAGLS